MYKLLIVLSIIFSVSFPFTTFADLTELDLFDAISNGDMIKLKNVLDAGVDPNSKDKDGVTPLLLMTDIKCPQDIDLEIIKTLVKSGASVNLPGTSNFLRNAGNIKNGRSKNGWTPLMSAVSGSGFSCKGEEIIKFLLENGADPNQENENSETAFLLSLSGNVINLQRLDMFFKAGLDLNKGANKNWIGSIWTYENNVDDIIEMAKFLYEKNNCKIQPDLNCQIKTVENSICYLEDNRTKVDYRVMNFMIPLIKEINPHVLNGKYESGRRVGKTALMNSFASIFCGGYNNVSPEERIKFLEAMINYGADFNVVDDKGNSLLFYTASQCSSDINELIIKHGANSNSINKTSMNFLMASLSFSYEPNFSTFFKFKDKFDLESKDKFGNTAIFYAVQSFNAYNPDKFEAMKNAIKAFDYKALNKFGQNLLHYAIVNRKFVDLKSESEYSLPNRNLIQYLLDLGLDVNNTNIYSESLLMTAVRAFKNEYLGALDLYKLLLENGANPSQKNKSGESALDILKTSTLDKEYLNKLISLFESYQK